MAKRFLSGHRGLTLLEMAVVGAILSILAGLTAVAVTGAATSAGETSLISDLSEVSKAAASYSGQQARAEYPTLNGCLPGRVKVSGVCTTAGAPTAAAFPSSGSPTEVAVWLGNSTNWAAIVWDKGFTSGGTTKTFSKNFLFKLPKHAKEHADASFSPWARTVADPDGVISEGLPVPRCAGSPDTASSDCAVPASNAPVWVFDRDGQARVVIPSSKF